MLPDTRRTDLPFLCSSVTPDSVVCFDVGTTGVMTGGDPITLGSYCCLSLQSFLASLAVPHWMTEFKRQEKAGLAALRQLQIALVPVLYQRRALGYPDHFVFGTWPVAEFVVQVIAATWVPKGGTQPVSPRSNTSTAQPEEDMEVSSDEGLIDDLLLTITADNDLLPGRIQFNEADRRGETARHDARDYPLGHWISTTNH
jgi:hypothetical protein